jgi:ABC-type transport system involved in multi-copper enzyme maturation permease subunit
MMNPFKIRKWAALMIPGLLCPVGFYIGLVFYGLLGGLGFLAGVLLISLLFGFVLLKNPFSTMLEGAGILAINITSTGILKPFIVQVKGPYVVGKVGKKDVYDIFDREAVMNIEAPKKATKSAYWNKDGKLCIELGEDDYNKNRFGLFQYPVLLWNDAIESFVTKDFLSESEKSVFAEHSILYVKKRLEDLTSAVRDFGRHIVENLKPQSNFLKSKWFVIIVIVLIAIIVILFAPAVLEQVTGFGGVGDAVGRATGAVDQTVTPLAGG